MIYVFLSFSGLIFLLHHSELSTNVILALRGSDALKKEEPVPHRYASVLISKGFVCHPEEIGMIVEKHLRVVSFIYHLDISIFFLINFGFASCSFNFVGLVPPCFPFGFYCHC